jgi:hypothetical protein
MSAAVNPSTDLRLLTVQDYHRMVESVSSCVCIARTRLVEVIGFRYSKFKSSGLSKPMPPHGLTIPLDRLQLASGSIVAVPDISWEQYQQLLTRTEDRHSYRLTYDRGKLKIACVRQASSRPYFQ